MDIYWFIPILLVILMLKIEQIFGLYKILIAISVSKESDSFLSLLFACKPYLNSAAYVCAEKFNKFTLYASKLMCNHFIMYMAVRLIDY